ncbi:MAG: arginase [Negativicutes bacterium]|jgi:arginase
MAKAISVIGVPMWLGQTKFGTSLGPNAIRAAGVNRRLKALTGDVIDMGNLTIGSREQRPLDTNLKNLAPIAKACEKLADCVAGVIRKGRFPLVLGGDHSIAMGTLAGVAQHYSSLGVIWYDAHADINTPETSPTGNIHGMPLAASMGYGHPALTKIGGFIGKVKPENVVFIGVRDIDPGEAELIAAKGIKVYTARDVHRLGIKNVINEAIEYLSRCDGIHLSFDLDGIDPVVAPGVGTPVPGGISYLDSLEAVRMLCCTERIVSAEFVEVNSLLDKADTTAAIAADLVGALFGETGQEVPASEPAAAVLSVKTSSISS